MVLSAKDKEWRDVGSVQGQFGKTEAYLEEVTFGQRHEGGEGGSHGDA